MTTLRVATFNIRNGRAFDGCGSWPFRKRSVLRTIEALDADVLALQEVHPFQLRWLWRRLDAYDVVAQGRDADGGGEACPVFVRCTVGRIASTRTLWFGEGEQRRGLRMDGARFPRIATIARVEARGWTLDVTNTHFDASSTDRQRESAEQLLATLGDDLPQVVVGDLNAGPKSDVVAAFLTAGYRDALAATTGGTFHRFTGRTDGPRIDHVLVSTDIEVEDATIDRRRHARRLPSDHWPAVATLRLPT